MRRVFVAASICAAILLFVAPAALALPAPLHPVGHAAANVHAPYAKRSVERAPFRYEPLARRILSGTGTISLDILTYGGQPEVNAEADWWVFGDLDYGFGHANTDANGHVELTSIPAATDDNGEIAVFPDDAGNTVYDLWGLSWGDGVWTGQLQPGQLPVTVVRSSDRNWYGWTAATVRLWSVNGAETHLASSDITRTGATTYGTAPTITTGPEQLDAGTIHFWNDEGMELPVAGTDVSPGVAAPGVIAREVDAQRIWMDYWGSGKPGTRTYLIMNNFPAGWTNDIAGVADYPTTANVQTVGGSTSSGGDYTVKRVIIPSGAKPGYKYWVWADHRDGSLSLTTSFQTCTLKRTRSVVRKGTAIALSGVVPIKGHYGGKTGTRKYVTVYKTTKSKLAAKGQPPVAGGGSRASGWTRVGRVRTDGLGRYRKGSIRPARTTWYAVWYPGDSWYWGAWTSLAKVTVR